MFWTVSKTVFLMWLQHYLNVTKSFLQHSNLFFNQNATLFERLFKYAKIKMSSFLVIITTLLKCYKNVSYNILLTLFSK